MEISEAQRDVRRFLPAVFGASCSPVLSGSFLLRSVRRHRGAQPCRRCASMFLPFLFGMWQFGALGLVFAVSGLVYGSGSAEHFVIAGWYGAIVQLLFALPGLNAIPAENCRAAA